MRNTISLKRTAISVLVAALMVGGAQAATVQHIAGYQFTVNDLVADHDGRMFGPAGNGRYQAVLCGLPGVPACDADHPPIAGIETPTLYPIDSEFGFNVVAFAQAFGKEIGDGVWGEGYIGNIKDQGKYVGIEISDAETDTFKVPAPFGTWCAGIGETSVKCSTERYVVMEHVLNCHETIGYVEGEYDRTEPTTGDQGVLYAPDDLDSNGDPLPGAIPLVDCADTKFDNDPVILASGESWDGKTLSQAVADMDPIDPKDPLSFLEPNESTVLDDIAYTADYAMTAKDDGKPLYRWGTLIKRPNDVRLYARIKLPNAWKSGGLCDDGRNNGYGCPVTKATLYVYHNITNNPNDQVRPEDMENEAAIGRLPGYTVDGSGSRRSDVDCYEGDGDFIPTGTYLTNTWMAEGGLAAVVGTDPYAWSRDLKEGISNAFATTVDREPFEWSYDSNLDGSADYSVREPYLASPGDTLLSGPRWRLTPPKFGQDIPGLEIPNVECAPPPYKKALIKYEVGEPPPPNGRVALNVLDWNPDDERSIDDPQNPGTPVSPLAYTAGWVDGNKNDGQVICDGPEAGDPQSADGECTPVDVSGSPHLTAVSVNGAPVSEDFDLSIYIKGDRKPTQLYQAWLIVEYDDGL
ncbi:MAG: hypothetical protein QNJ11_15990 [Woeseiaceae bacterium]|nr:hypothetical protein [Woeseiaceae bacterium]